MKTAGPQRTPRLRRDLLISGSFLSFCEDAENTEVAQREAWQSPADRVTVCRMSRRIIFLCLFACLLVLLNEGGVTRDIGSHASAQTSKPVASPQPSPPPQRQDPLPQQQESVKIYTEEVLLPVIATDSGGRFDPTLEPTDLLILEDGEPQTIRSVRRIPANVLLVLDTGGATNPAMRTNATRELAMRLVSQLREGDEVAALQFGGRVELIQSWTAEKEAAIHSLKSKLFSGRGGRLQAALSAAAEQLKTAPPGNRHIVLVTDGGESLIDTEALAAGMKELFATQATIHVISYTSMGRKTISAHNRKVPVVPIAVARKSKTDRNQYQPVPPDPSVAPISPDADKRLAEDLKHKSLLRILLTGSYKTGIDLDFPMRRHNREQLKTLKQNELWLAWLAEESGGDIALPASEEDLPTFTDELAREIDSQYVVTYRPKSPVVLKSEAEIRRVEVISRRVGLQVRSRRSYVVTTPSK